MYTQKEKIVPVCIEDEMKSSYLDYSMSVIVGRALPDVRDGLKPVHRRILYAMQGLGLEHNKPYKKCARIVGETLGKFHPHGDVAVYDSLVRMVQDFSLRYPLIDGQGNFGSIDGDAPAAMRYTEARMQRITDQLLLDIDKNTVDFVPNFDNSLTEPSVLPARIPNLLINGSSGIAVGMATNIPSHNLSEVIQGLNLLLDEPEVSIDKLMTRIEGPDFPTGGIICGREGIKQAYTTGRGVIKIQGRAGIEKEKGREAIIISEIPYQVNKAELIKSIAALVQAKKLEGISDVRDESDREGMRIVIQLKKDANSQVVLNQLYKQTQLRSTFGIIMLALVKSKPLVLNLKQMLNCFIEHREDVITRRTRFELEKAEKRAHILEGLTIALNNLDEVIQTIKNSKTVEEAKINLIKKFSLSELQAKAILEMQLQRLTALEKKKIKEEYLELLKKIEEYKLILKSKQKVRELIKQELSEIEEKFGDERRTEILAEEEDLEIEDLIAKQNVLVTISHLGYIKRFPVSHYRRQRRGGKGVTAAEIRDKDFLENIFVASTHDYILFFSNKGRVYWLKVFEIPEAGRMAKGRAIVNLLQLSPGELIASCICVKGFEEGYLLLATRNGLVKKTELRSYSHPRKGGIVAIDLDKDDELIGCKISRGEDEIFLASQKGKAIRFSEKEVRATGRASKGVRGIRLSKDDKLISLELVEKNATILTVTEEGFGKRTEFSAYKKQSRGGKGIINIKTTKRNGNVVSVKTVNDKDELILITAQGMVVRTATSEIRTISRNTQGVKLVSLKPSDKVVAVAKVIEEEE
ncbi:MAG: DNA gyrase subunit A [Candidatus Omnitrophica bacterium 4484_213]|nr:MAG: DNA gyrase subunit A [Candidatus Omnitrophica bacterium 4484_213]